MNRNIKRMNIFLVLAIVMTSVFTFGVPSIVSAEGNGTWESPYTVAQGISNQGKNGTVVGYIVGEPIADKKVNFSNFAGDTAIAIADSPNETNTNNMLYIKVNAAYRANFGLNTNPGIIKKYVSISGKLTPYFKPHPGLDTVSRMEFADGTIPNPDPNPSPGIKISAIQGTAHKSPMVGKDVTGVQGIVTGIFTDNWNNGFFIQDINPDNDESTSEGIFIDRKKFNTSAYVNIGDLVSVDGVVAEDKFETVFDNTLTVTQIKARKVSILSSGNNLPSPVIIGKNGKIAPDLFHNGNWNEFDPITKALDFYESFEGMLVEVEAPLVVGVREDYGEIVVLPDLGEYSKDRFTNNKGVLAVEGQFNPQRILISDNIKTITNNKRFIDPNYKIKTGDTFDGSIVGVMSYDFGNYKLYNTKSLPKLIDGGTRSEITWIEPEEDKLTLVTYNIENFSAKSTDRLDRLAIDIIEGLKSPDIIGLVEVQDNDGEGKSAGTDATGTLKAIIKAIKDNGGPEYGYVNINPVNNQDGGAPNANIRCPIIYRKDRVSLVEGKPQGNATTAVGLEGQGKDVRLTLNPGRIEPTNPAFISSRKPMIAEFIFKGEKVFVINNHFNSKRGDTPLFGDTQPQILGSEDKRVEQAKAVNRFVKEILSRDPDANVVIVGDLNDYQFSKPLKAVEGNEMINTINLLPLGERHTYIYEGNSQVLDHILVTKNLEDKVDVDIVNMNSEFVISDGRISDHDPVIVQIDFNKEIVLEDKLIIEKPIIDGFKLGENSEITITVKNGTLDNQDITLILALFEKNENRIVSLNILEKNIKGNSVDTLTTSLNIPESGSYIVKYFVWDNVRNMKPLTSPEVIIVE